MCIYFARSKLDRKRSRASPKLEGGVFVAKGRGGQCCKMRMGGEGAKVVLYSRVGS